MLNIGGTQKVLTWWMNESFVDQLLTFEYVYLDLSITSPIQFFSNNSKQWETLGQRKARTDGLCTRPLNLCGIIYGFDSSHKTNWQSRDYSCLCLLNHASGRQMSVAGMAQQ